MNSFPRSAITHYMVTKRLPGMSSKASTRYGFSDQVRNSRSVPRYCFRAKITNLAGRSVAYM